MDKWGDPVRERATTMDKRVTMNEDAAAALHEGDGLRRWWETRWFVALAALLTAVPLLYPPIPPLVDLFGHLGRYRAHQLANRSRGRRALRPPGGAARRLHHDVLRRDGA